MKVNFQTPKKYTPEKIRFDLLIPMVALVSTGYIVGSVTGYITGGLTK